MNKDGEFYVLYNLNNMTHYCKVEFIEFMIICLVYLYQTLLLCSGRDQVLIGVVPSVCPVSSNQSPKSVFPLVPANCKENR